VEDMIYCFIGATVGGRRNVTYRLIGATVGGGRNVTYRLIGATVGGGRNVTYRLIGTTVGGGGDQHILQLGDHLHLLALGLLLLKEPLLQFCFF